MELLGDDLVECVSLAGRFRNFGQKSLSEIEQVLTERGLHFGMDLSKLGLDDIDK